MRKMLHALGDKASRRSLCLALAGTLGVGNILGVSMGIIIGGAGSVFWIFVSGFFSAVIKYCECTLSADMSGSIEGGMHKAVRKSFKRLGVPLSYVYAALCLLLSLTMGTMLQSNAVSGSLLESFGIKKACSGIFFLLITLVLLLFFSKKIDSLTAAIIPITTLIYTILMLFVIFSNVQRVPSAISAIINGAFTRNGTLGGTLVSVNSIALREGFARGLLSNEAGAGTSAMAQTRQNQEPSTVGLMGSLEVFFDTTLLCTLTGLAICVGTSDFSGYETGMDLICATVKATRAPFLSALMPALILMFAVSTVICWYYYGKECMKYISGREGAVYKLLFVLSVLLGAGFAPKAVIIFVDAVLLLMSVITLLTLKKNSERIFYLSDRSGLLK